MGLMVTGWTFDRTGDHPVLDFANTVSERTGPNPIERLASYDDVVEFARQSSVITEEDAARLRERAAGRPDEAQRAHRAAVALRDAIYSVFAAIAEGERPAAADLQVLNEHLGKLRLTDDLDLRYGCAENGLDTPLGPLVRAALDLLTTRRDRVNLCCASDCRFLFLDTSKNKSRRWCDMKQCGNREKARRHHARVRGRADDGCDA